MLQLLLYIAKNCEIILLRNLTVVSQNTPKIISICHPLQRNDRLKKLKILSFLAPFISKTKKTNIYIFFITQLFLLTLIFNIYWSTIIEIMGHRTCYFGSLDRADNKENSSKLANTFFLKGTINSSVRRKFQVF